MLTELRDKYLRYSEDINQRYPNPNGLTASDVQRWSTAAGDSRSDLYNQIAVWLAFGFHTSEFNFDFCDAIVNDIHQVIALGNEALPDLFWTVFLAFDAGEFYPDDNRDRDPVDTFTRPKIAQIVEKLKGAQEHGPPSCR
jgi:hypothetical protein